LTVAPRHSDDYTPEDAAADDWHDRVRRHMETTGIEDFNEAETDLREADGYAEYERQMSKGEP
jgi:hypothetical protein